MLKITVRLLPFPRSTIQIVFYLSAVLYYRLPFFGMPGKRLDIALRAIFGTIAAISIYMSYRQVKIVSTTNS